MLNKNLFSISVLNANNKDYTYNLDYFPQGTKRIFVTVLDVNDNYPQFENSPYDVNVSEVSRREFTIFFFRFNHFRNVASFYIKSIFLCDCLNRKMSDETLICA